MILINIRNRVLIQRSYPRINLANIRYLSHKLIRLASMEDEKETTPDEIS